MSKEKGTAKKGMTREQAAELYRDLQKAMSTLREKGSSSSRTSSSTRDVAKEIAQAIRAKLSNGDAPRQEAPSADAARVLASAGLIGAPQQARKLPLGSRIAVLCILVAAALKVTMSVMEGAGVLSPAQANAAISKPGEARLAPGTFSKEELSVLTQLDQRRAELEKRRERLDERERDMQRLDREYATKLTQLRELTESLRIERERGDKKRSAQIEQLANVYGSMNPPEAAQLLEQLDMTIALALIERMPEKRIAQILSLMDKERALTITKMLSGRRTQG